MKKLLSLVVFFTFLSIKVEAQQQSFILPLDTVNINHKIDSLDRRLGTLTKEAQELNNQLAIIVGKTKKIAASVDSVHAEVKKLKSAGIPFSKELRDNIVSYVNALVLDYQKAEKEEAEIIKKTEQNFKESDSIILWLKEMERVIKEMINSNIPTLIG